MKPYIILPLADEEEQRVPNFDVIFKKIKTSECYKPFDHLFWSEVGKFITSAHILSNRLSGIGPLNEINYQNKNKFGIKGIIQNRRYFKNLDKLQVNSSTEVILAKEEWLGGLTVVKQFQFCHPESYSIFEDILKKLKLNEDMLEIGSISPHNIFLSKNEFFFDYASFLEETLMPYFDENIKEKAGAWIAERLLHLFAHMYYKVKIADFEILPKLK